jgi:hypothetical protein
VGGAAVVEAATAAGAVDLEVEAAPVVEPAAGADGVVLREAARPAGAPRAHPVAAEVERPRVVVA